MNYDLVIRNGTVVTPIGPVETDLGISGERIATIDRGLPDGERTIDAAGKLVVPGGIDPHVHLQMPAGPVTSSDDFYTGTVAAACGGTTTIIDFVEPEGGSLIQALAARRAEAEGKAVIDFGLHMTIMDAQPTTLAEIPYVVGAGCTSFKTYLTYEGFKLEDGDLLAALEAVAGAGGLALVHAENDAIVTRLKARLLREDHVEPRWHPRSRPAVAEAEAVERALALAEVAGCPLYVVHVSTARGADAVGRARSRGQVAHGETCPQYLVLTEEEYERPGFEGAKFVCSPPLRTAADGQALWESLAAGHLSTVGTDHCPFFYRGQKDLGRPDGVHPPFSRIPGGIPGIESRLALLYTYGVREGWLSVERWVEICSTGPARIFGLAGRKGSLVEGSDADVVVFDPERVVKLSRSLLHENCDYTPYEGVRLKGYPEMTILRGQIIAQGGEFVGERSGRYLAR
jgi:dihydropyrimidinase